MNAKNRRPLVNSGPWCIPPDLLADNDGNRKDEQGWRKKICGRASCDVVCLRSPVAIVLEQAHAHTAADGYVMTSLVHDVDPRRSRHEPNVGSRDEPLPQAAWTRCLRVPF